MSMTLVLGAAYTAINIIVVIIINTNIVIQQQQASTSAWRVVQDSETRKVFRTKTRCWLLIREKPVSMRRYNMKEPADERPLCCSMLEATHR